MHWPRCLAALFVVLALAGALPWRLDRDRRRTRPISKAILATPAECTNRRAGQRAPARSQGRPVPIGARVATGFRVDLVKPNRPLRDNAACPPPHRDPRRRCGRLLAPDGRG